jgi:hypothetical protein
MRDAQRLHGIHNKEMRGAHAGYAEECLQFSKEGAGHESDTQESINNSLKTATKYASSLVT